MNIFAYLVSSMFIFASNIAFAAADAAHGHGDAHSKSDAGLPQFDITTFPSQIFWLAVAFFILYTIFSSKILPDISVTIENRKETIESNLEESEKMKIEAEEIKRKYNETLMESKNEAVSIIQASTSKSKAEMETQLAAFQKKAEKEILLSSERIEKSKQDIYADLNNIAAEIVQKSLKQVAGIDITTEEALSVIEPLTQEQAKAA